VRSGRYPLRDLVPALGEDYDKLDVEPLYLARGGTALRLSLIYGEHDRLRREEFVLRRVRAGRRRIPFGAGTSVRWHLENPPAEADGDFSADDRALAAATGASA